jgi:hypothetical protein
MWKSKNGQAPLIEARTFTGVMDKDSDLRAIAPNNYRELFCGFNGVTTTRGTVTNVPSNVEVTFQMFNGENKIIGAIEDLQDSSVVFYNYNSFGYHGIYRWFRNKQGYVNGVIEQVKIVKDPTVYNPFHPNPFNFQKTSENLITGAWQVDNLNFFTDYFNRSKFIDMLRANETNKRRIFDLYFNRASFVTNTQYILTLWLGGNPVQINSWTWTTATTNYKDQTDAFLDAYQASFGFNAMSNYFAAESCAGNFPKITINTQGEYYLQIQAIDLTTGNPINQPVMVADNFYPDHNAVVPSYDPLSDDLIDRLCYTALCMPTATYETDTTRETNFVRNKVYQFRIQYQYFDNSFSVYSAISTIPIAEHQCDANNFGNSGNFIKILFEDERLFNPALVSIIKHVEIAMLEPQIGATWVTIKRLDPFEFAGIGMQEYDFYNDQTTQPIDQKTTDKQFESLFIKHKSDEYVDDRGFSGGGVEGYGAPCVDAEIFVDYLSPAVVSKGHDIFGTLGITNVWYDGGTDPAYQIQAIWKDGSAGQIVWGGWGHQGGGYAMVDPSAYQQRIPLAGFVMYLAGTPYFGVTKQRIITAAAYPFLSAITIPPQDSSGVFVLTTSSDKTNFSDMLNAFWQAQTYIPQDYIIKNVPDGAYVLRTASHLTVGTDLGEPSFAYQKTSTNVLRYVGGITLQRLYEDYLTMNGANINMGNGTTMLDLVGPTGGKCAIMCYAVGDDGNPPTTIPEFVGKPRMDLSYFGITPFDDSNSHRLEHSYADHNGYSWQAFINTSGTENITNITSGANNGALTTSIDLTSGVIPAPGSTTNIGVLGVYQTIDATIQSFSRTHLIGTIVDSATGQPVSGISVINTHGQWTFTDGNGTFNIIAYVDTVVQPTRTDKVLFSSNSLVCQFTFNTIGQNYSITINVGNPPNHYNDLHPYPVGTFIVTVVDLVQSLSAWARGSDRFFGLVYGDEGDRKSPVSIINQPVHITFFTEKDSNGVLQPTGPATIRVHINNEPPSWATKYWIVAMSNQQFISQLIWAANKVDYIGADGNVNNSNPVKVRINIDNIAYYTQNLHPNAIISYSPNPADQLRVISTNFNGNIRYLNYEVLSADANNIYIEVDSTITLKAGDTFQLYTPRGQEQTRIFYEIGHCGKVKDAIINGVLKKYHEGNDGDQSYGTFPLAINTPAKINLTWGDIYYRTRAIPFNYDPAQPTLIPQQEVVNVMDQSVSDFYSSRAIGWGRPNTDAIEQGQIDRISTIRFSNRYISGTLINGLRGFEALNEKQLSTQYGLITKLIFIDNTVLKALFSNSFCVSNYINQGVLRTATGAALISISDDVMPNTHLMQRRFGTLNPESVVLNDQGDLFWWDENLGVIARSSGNALEAVSDALMNSAFTKIGNQRNTLGRNNSEAPATYDKNRDLYIISFRPMQPKDEVKSSVIVDAFDCEPVPPGVIFVQLYVRPLNVVLMAAIINGDPDYPDISKIIVKYVTAFGNGWSATTNEYGQAVIYTPDGSSIYYNQALVLTYLASTGNKSFTYTFTNGEPAGTGTPYEGETLAYCKDPSKKGWTEYYPFVPEYYGILRMEYVSFVDGKLWLHGDESQYNNFYGVQYTRKLTVPFNQNWEKIKILTHLQLNTNSQPFCPNIDIPANAQNPIGMNTELTKLHFKVVHGKYWADMTKDKLTPDQLMRSLPLTVDNKWVNGREMTGQVGLIEICNDTNELAPIIEAQLGFLFSEKS